MKIYFLSSQPCALRINGLHFGITDKFERFAEIALSDNLFIEFIPQNAAPVSFFLNESIRFSPPNGCAVYLLRDGIALYACEFPPKDFRLKIITQQRFEDNLVTVYSQGGLQISLETAQGFFISTLPPSFFVCQLSYHAELFFVEGEKHLAVYTKSGKCVFLEEIIDFSIRENELNATLPLSDSKKRIAKCSWSLSPEGCQPMGVTLLQATDNPAEKTDDFPADLLAYAFFESLLIGAEIDEFLSDELSADKQALLAFIGDFVAVLPTEIDNECAVIKKKDEKLYEAIYYRVEIKNGRICDVRV